MAAWIGFDFAWGSGTETFSYVASGGTQSGGAALATKGKNYIASGGAVSGGMAVLAKGKAFAAGSGGTQSGGAALATKGKNYIASGGAVSGGVSSTLLTGVGTIFSYTTSGGAQSGGYADTTLDQYVVPISLADYALVPKKRKNIFAYRYNATSGFRIGDVAAHCLILTSARSAKIYNFVPIGGNKNRGLAAVEFNSRLEAIRRMDDEDWLLLA